MKRIQISPGRASVSHLGPGDLDRAYPPRGSLARGGMHATPTHMIPLVDCAEMCEKAANSLARSFARRVRNGARQ